jgi:hypothetical protein
MGRSAMAQLGDTLVLAEGDGQHVIDEQACG